MASSRFSVSSWQTMRRREAPIDSRMPISRWRATPRASSRLATLAHPISRIRPKAKKSGGNTSTASAGCGTVPSLGSSTRFAAGRSIVPSATRRESHAMSAARARPLDRPGFSRPTTLRPVASSPPWLRPRKWPRRASGAQKSGEADREPSKARRHDPDDLERGVVHQDRAIEDGRIGREVPRPATMAEHDDRTAAGSSSDGVSVRPRAAVTPSTWKKLPVTSEPCILRPSIRLSTSGVRARHRRTRRSRGRSASYCGRREALGLRAG